jgi:hypothetical protein
MEGILLQDGVIGSPHMHGILPTTMGINHRHLPVHAYSLPLRAGLVLNLTKLSQAFLAIFCPPLSYYLLHSVRHCLVG